MHARTHARTNMQRKCDLGNRAPSPAKARSDCQPSHSEASARRVTCANKQASADLRFDVPRQRRGVADRLAHCCLREPTVVTNGRVWARALVESSVRMLWWRALALRGICRVGGRLPRQGS
jgi:hypothetical protein